MGLTRVATWNVNGIRARQAQFQDWIARERPDVVCLQEIKASPEKLDEALCGLPGYWCTWHGSGGYSGVALLLRRDRFASEPPIAHPELDRENRLVTARLGAVEVVSVYVPNGGRDLAGKLQFLRGLQQLAADRRRQGIELLLCGDLNVARAEIDVHPKERRPRVVGQLPEERQLFAELLAGGLVDLGRHFAPRDEGLFTWWAPWRNLRQRNIGWRIDYVLASAGLAAGAVGCVVQPEVGTSDHAPVVAELELP
ncbi:MAG TPA: exodeoxyribonuclease III [Thermoanaerobaculia bacterium]|nr:exodeoxyribonuclease III [Thermoanaerobaculia bacterium]